MFYFPTRGREGTKPPQPCCSPDDLGAGGGCGVVHAAAAHDECPVPRARDCTVDKVPAGVLWCCAMQWYTVV